VIELEDLSREFNGRVAVEGLTFGVEEGEIFGLLGPNGAGKTTTVRMLCSLIRPTRGRARVCGHDVVEEAERVREVVGLLPENGFPRIR
jgi:ABC-2 type transport system ATP-binding protein